MDKCFHKIKVPLKKEFKKVVHNNYIQKTKDKLSKLTDNSKLYLYKKHSYAIFPYKNNNHIFYDYSEINQKGPPVGKTLLK